MLRERGVVGKFVEFYGDGLANLPLADRATIGNMSPEYGATCGIFPVDAETLRYLEFTGRPPELVALVEAYCKEQGLFHDASSEDPTYSDTLELDLSDVEPSLAGPKRPQDRVPLADAKAVRRCCRTTPGRSSTGTTRNGRMTRRAETSRPATSPRSADERAPHTAAAAAEAAQSRSARSGRSRARGRHRTELDHGYVVIAAITSCTNTSNPVGDARRRAAREEGRRARAAAQAVGEDEPRAGLEGRDRVPRPRRASSRTSTSSASTSSATAARPASATPARCRPPIAEAIEEQGPRGLLGAVGQPQLRGRASTRDVKMNYLASPPLCVAYALAGHMDVDLTTEPMG